MSSLTAKLGGFNFFPDHVEDPEEHLARIGRWKTRAFFFLLPLGIIGYFFILIAQGRSVSLTTTVSSYEEYQAIAQRYMDQLQCPCAGPVFVHDFVGFLPLPLGQYDVPSTIRTPFLSETRKDNHTVWKYGILTNDYHVYAVPSDLGNLYDLALLGLDQFDDEWCWGVGLRATPQAEPLAESAWIGYTFTTSDGEIAVPWANEGTGKITGSTSYWAWQCAFHPACRNQSMTSTQAADTSFVATPMQSFLYHFLGVQSSSSAPLLATSAVRKWCDIATALREDAITQMWDVQMADTTMIQATELENALSLQWQVTSRAIVSQMRLVAALHDGCWVRSTVTSSGGGSDQRGSCMDAVIARLSQYPNPLSSLQPVGKSQPSLDMSLFQMELSRGFTSAAGSARWIVPPESDAHRACQSGKRGGGGAVLWRVLVLTFVCMPDMPAARACLLVDFTACKPSQCTYRTRTYLDFWTLAGLLAAMAGLWNTILQLTLSITMPRIYEWTTGHRARPSQICSHSNSKVLAPETGSASESSPTDSPFSTVDIPHASHVFGEPHRRGTHYDLPTAVANGAESSEDEAASEKNSLLPSNHES